MTMVDRRFYENKGPFKLQEIVVLGQATINFSSSEILEDQKIFGVATLKHAQATDLSFFHNAKYIEDLKATKAGWVFTTQEFSSLVPTPSKALVTEAPYRSYAKVASHFYPNVENDFVSMSHPISPTAEIGEGVILEPGVVVREGASIGAGTFIGANAVIGKGVIIGESCRIGQNVTVSHAILGNKITILPGTRIGQAGFGFFMDEKGFITVPQLGRVIIEDSVEIGANVTIDRGTLEDTFIGQGTRIDNLVQIAHGVQIGKNCVLVAQVGIAGSTRLGNYVIAAGQAGFTGHLKIEDGAKIAAQAGVMRDIKKGEAVAGSPAVPVHQWHRQTVSLAKLARTKQKEK